MRRHIFQHTQIYYTVTFSKTSHADKSVSYGTEPTIQREKWKSSFARVRKVGGKAIEHLGRWLFPPSLGPVFWGLLVFLSEVTA